MESFWPMLIAVFWPYLCMKPGTSKNMSSDLLITLSPLALLIYLNDPYSIYGVIFGIAVFTLPACGKLFGAMWGAILNLLILNLFLGIFYYFDFYPQLQNHSQSTWFYIYMGSMAINGIWTFKKPDLHWLNASIIAYLVCLLNPVNWANPLHYGLGFWIILNVAISRHKESEPWIK